MARRQPPGSVGAATPDTEHWATLGCDARFVTRLARRVPHLHAWYRANSRSLPWRATREPYDIWVSEAMLQQTQVATVVPYYERWMARFPTLRDLAAADQADVLMLWEGLGYYSRARNLHRAAQMIVRDHSGAVPADIDQFRALPGVGPYTAAAVMSIAYGLDHAVVDGNVKRVLARLLALDELPTKPAVGRAIDRLAQRILPAGTASLHNQAVMELGALVCSPRAPRCDDCPLQTACRGKEAAEQYPRKPPRRSVPHHHLAVAVVEQGGRLLLYQRPEGGMLAGLWDFPAARVCDPSGGQAEPRDMAATLKSAVRERYGVVIKVGEPMAPLKHAYTHLKVTLHPRRCRYVRSGSRASEITQEYAWIDDAGRQKCALPRASQKVWQAWARDPAKG